jgi:hypothetical protein
VVDREIDRDRQSEIERDKEIEDITYCILDYEIDTTTKRTKRAANHKGKIH